VILRLTLYAPLAVLLLGTGLGVGLGLSQATTSAGAVPSPTIPNGWKAVSYRGIVLDVPPTWVVKGWQLNDVSDACGVSTPTVLLGPEPSELMKVLCPLYSRGDAEVNIGARRPVVVKPRTAVINGLHVAVSFSTTKIIHGNPAPFANQVAVHIPIRDIWITIQVGTSPVLPGGAPGRAMQIVRSIHAASG